MKTLKSDWLMWLMLLLPFVFIAVYWDKFPDQIAIHFNMSGEPNGYGGKIEGLFLMPVINIGMYFLFIVLPKIDPRKANYALFADKYRIIRIVLHVFFTFSFFVNSFYALGYHFNMGLIVLYGVLGLFLVLGNYMGNVRPNFFVGVRTPWTLSNEEVWVKTHRLTAKVWVVGSLAMMIVLPFVPHLETMFLIFIAIICVVPIAYSYIIYKKIKTN